MPIPWLFFSLAHSAGIAILAIAVWRLTGRAMETHRALIELRREARAQIADLQANNFLLREHVVALSRRGPRQSTQADGSVLAELLGDLGQEQAPPAPTPPTSFERVLKDDPEE